MRSLPQGMLHPGQEEPAAPRRSADRGAFSQAGPAASGEKPLRILIVDGHTLARDELAALLARQPDMQVVGQAATAYRALKLAEELCPDLVLIDFVLQDGEGDDVARSIYAMLPAARIVFLTGFKDEQRIRDAILAGATGYLLKGIAASELLARLRRLGAGEVELSPEVGRFVLERLSAGMNAASERPAAVELFTPIAPGLLSMLTDREIALLRMIGRGYTNRLIADALKLSLRTVEYHRANLADRLGLHSRADLVRYAIRVGLLPHAPLSKTKG